MMLEGQKTFAVYTLGCKLNFSESSTVMNYFKEAGYNSVRFPQEADVYLINTCTVTANAGKKSRNAIARAVASNPDALIIVTGCYAQLSHQEISDKFNVDYIIGINNYSEIKNILENPVKPSKQELIHTTRKDMNLFFPSYKAGNRTRAFLKIQDGCDYFCSYCTIPLARGKSRSQNIESTLIQIDEIISKNIKEIVLTGINIGDFGKTSGESLYDLLNRIVEKDLPARFRVGSVEPDLLDERMIELIAGDNNIMPHFHIPLQSGSNSVLNLMNRKYDTELFARKIELIKEMNPYSFIGTDLIVGINGETDAYFRESADFIREMPVSAVHVFSYSERKDTKAASFKPVISVAEKRKRADVIKAISGEKHEEFLKTNIGKTRNVLIESKTKEGLLTGYTDNYIKLEIDGQKQLLNKTVMINISGFSGKDKMTGKIVSE